MKVSAVMHQPVITVGVDTPLKTVARILVDNRISGLPVVEADGTVVGVVSEGDFVLRERGLAKSRPGAPRHSRSRTLASEKAEATNAGEAMTSPAVVISPDQTLEEAARLMLEYRVNRLPVLRGGELVGIVARSDLVRAFVRSDEELERAIIDDIVTRAMWLEPTSVNVQVDGGSVIVSGTLERRSLASILVSLIERTEGVISVDPRLDWLVDDTALRPLTDDLKGVQELR